MDKNEKVSINLEKVLLIIIFILAILDIYLSFCNELYNYGGLFNFFMARKYRVVISLFVPIYCIFNFFCSNKSKKGLYFKKKFNALLIVVLIVKSLRRGLMIINGFNQFGYVELLESRYDIAVILYDFVLIIALLINKTKLFGRIIFGISLCMIIYSILYSVSSYSLFIYSFISLIKSVLLLYYIYKFRA